ncbi:MAG TPA: hypothetical protein PKH94_10410 [Bacteroidales bacterium]|nr:hypothetical protein [Bacteroidales bacterium]HNS47644.1 hypothetical protein [Bacteroidales bacterium]
MVQNQGFRDEIQRTTQDFDLVKTRLTEMDYFTRLLEFIVGLLIILMIALFILLLIHCGKNRSLRRMVAQLDQQIKDAQRDLAGESHRRSSTPVNEERSDCAGGKGDKPEREITDLRNEIQSLKRNLIGEQQVRKQMEEEIADLLSRIRKSG